MFLKKYFVLVLFVFLILPLTVFAETALKKNYLDRRDEYFQVYDQFLSARSNYWQQNTIQSKQKFREQSREFLLVRSNLLLAYLDLLLSESSFVNSQSQEKLAIWQGWLIENQKEVRKAYSLEDLVSLSQKLDEVYPEIEHSIYSFLSTRVIRQQEIIRDELRQLSQELAVQTKSDDWQIEVSQQLDQAENHWQKARAELNKIRVVRPGDMQRRWEKVAEELVLAKNCLLKALNFLDEVISRND